MDKLKILFPLIILIIVLIPANASDIQRCALCHSKIAQNFTKSLHYTNQGIIIGWNRGAGKDFNMSIPPVCLKCHIENCSTCHPVHKALPNMTTCVECHKHKIGVNYIGYLVEKIKEGPSPDVHYMHNMTCMDCHNSAEIHGDGHNYTMAYYAVKIRCLDCHGNSSVVINGIKPKQYDPNILAHKLHRGLVSCYACHAVWYQTCYNCHLPSGKIDKVSISEFHVLRAPDGKLYPATIMSVVYNGKVSKVVGIVMPHTISPKARKCSDCHSSNASKVFLEGFNGRIVGPKGTEFAEPPSKLVFKVPILNIWIDSGMLGTLIIGATLAGICLHYLKRRITMGGE